MEPVTKRTVFFTMVRHPTRGLVRVGNAYASRKSAAEWIRFVRGAWRGCSTSISRCTLVWVGGVLTHTSRRLLDQKYNLDAPLADTNDRLLIHPADVKAIPDPTPPSITDGITTAKESTP